MLYPVMIQFGTPTDLRSDNGPKFIAQPFQMWLRKVGVESTRIFPGPPRENGYNRRFNGKLRREVLNAEWFASMRQARIVIDVWSRQYNRVRHHRSLYKRPPVRETLLGNRPKGEAA